MPNRTQHYEIRADFETGTDVLLFRPQRGGGFRDTEFDRISAETFYEFVGPGFQMRGVPIWDRDLGDWYLSPMAVAKRDMLCAEAV
jgi:hypothetical protein